MIALWIALAVVAAVMLVMGTFGYARIVRRRHVRGPRLGPDVRGAAKGPRTATRPRPAPPSPAPQEIVIGAEVETLVAGPDGKALVAETPAAEASVEVEVPVQVAAPTFRERLGRTRGVFAGLRSLRGKGVDPATWDELEESLLRADVGVATTDALIEDLRRRVRQKEVSGGDQLVEALEGDLVDLLSLERHWDAVAGAGPGPALGRESGSAEGFEATAPISRDLRFDDEEGVVNVWLFVGVNGVGKTTTVGKVARQQVAMGRSVLLAAGDTFRAAAGEQLAMWAERVGAGVVRGAEGGDPSAVVFDAVQRAAARGNALVLADTAGRLHTKVNLVEELKKIRRVAERPPGRVTEVLLVLDATTGQNGLVQARQFTEAVAVTGVVLTKLDGTAKGGIVVAIQKELGLPVKLVGLGEGPDDLVRFDPADFVGALLG